MKQAFALAALAATIGTVGCNDNISEETPVEVVKSVTDGNPVPGAYSSDGMKYVTIDKGFVETEKDLPCVVVHLNRRFAMSCDWDAARGENTGDANVKPVIVDPKASVTVPTP